MKKFLSKAIAPYAMAIGLGLASASAGAVVLPDFTVDEGSVPGNAAGTIVADKGNGAYSERITFDGAGNFVAAAYADFGQYLSNDGTSLVASQLNTNYGLYALFDASGTVAGGPAVFTFTGGAASFTLWIDPGQNTTKTLGATGSDPVTLAGNADDYQIASASSLVSGTGVLVAGVGGFFDFVFDDFTLTLDGQNYFIAPNPFYLRVNVDGDFDSFAVAGTQTVNGDLSFVFQVPEPGMLGMLGLGLLGVALMSRKKMVR